MLDLRASEMELIKRWVDVFRSGERWSRVRPGQTWSSVVGLRPGHLVRWGENQSNSVNERHWFHHQSSISRRVFKGNKSVALLSWKPGRVPIHTNVFDRPETK